MVALIVTIIILLILAGIAITTLGGDSGLFNRAKESKFKTEIKALQEAAYLYVMNHVAGNAASGAKEDITAGVENLETWDYELPDDTDTTTLENIIDSGTYNDKLIVYQGEFYYIYTRQKGEREKVKWCFEVDVKVWGYDDYDDFLENAEEEEEPRPKHDGSYVKSPDIWLCIPDLTGFDQRYTRYLTWGEEGTGDTEVGTWTYKAPPEGWYHYRNKQWANIIVENNGIETWLVWIPRYIYKLDNDSEIAEIRFVDKNNNWTNPENDQTTTWEEMEREWTLPEAFVWSDEEGNSLGESDDPFKKQLSGIWTTKYEVNDAIENKAIMIATITTTSIYVMNGKQSRQKEKSCLYMNGKQGRQKEKSCLYMNSK